MVISEGISGMSSQRLQRWFEKRNIGFKRVTVTSRIPRSDPVVIHVYVDALNITIIVIGIAGDWAINVGKTDAPYEISLKNSSQAQVR